MPAVDSPHVSFAAEKAAVDAALTTFANLYLRSLDGPVADAVTYSMLGEGKRLRAILLLAAYRAAGGTGDASALAARAAADACRVLELGNPQAGAIVRELMRASGAGGMIGGQLYDLEGEGTPLTLSELERVHRMKTGALINASVRIGGLAALASDETLCAFERYGSAVGLAFQIADDVLDVTSTTDELGKTAGRDAELKKSTYPALLGLDGARARADRLCDEACLALREAGIHSPQLETLARFVVDRRS